MIPLNANQLYQMKNMYEVAGMAVPEIAKFFGIEDDMVEEIIEKKNWVSAAEAQARAEVSARKSIKQAEEDAQRAAQAGDRKNLSREERAALEDIPEFHEPDSLLAFPLHRKRKELRHAHRSEMNDMRRRLALAIHKLDHTQYPDLVFERIKALKTGVDLLKIIQTRESELTGLKKEEKVSDNTIRVEFGDDSPAVSKGKPTHAEESASVEEDE